MKKIVFMSCALLLGSFVAQAQQDSDMVGTTTTTTKAVVKKEVKATSTSIKSKDETSDISKRSTKDEARMKKVLADRERRAAEIKANKKAENKTRIENNKTTPVVKTQAKVRTKADVIAEQEEKRKKATKKGN